MCSGRNSFGSRTRGSGKTGRCLIPLTLSRASDIYLLDKTCDRFGNLLRGFIIQSITLNADNQSGYFIRPGLESIVANYQFFDNASLDALAPFVFIRLAKAGVIQRNRIISNPDVKGAGYSSRFVSNL